MGEQAGIAVELFLRPVPAAGDPVMLTRLIGGLIHNGIRYNYAGGRVVVSTSCEDGVPIAVAHGAAVEAGTNADGGLIITVRLQETASPAVGGTSAGA
ncbi:hypothetical protein AB0B07_16420 [Streptomyces sioyaensis]|uniref:hypothetical protein n=1 Tax=Streptomyces sioyaensis TaxID=67364 RepID=UPI0033FA4830